MINVDRRDETQTGVLRAGLFLEPDKAWLQCTACKPSAHKQYASALVQLPTSCSVPWRAAYCARKGLISSAPPATRPESPRRSCCRAQGLEDHSHQSGAHTQAQSLQAPLPVYLAPVQARLRRRPQRSARAWMARPVIPRPPCRPRTKPQGRHGAPPCRKGFR